jgi:hypothetical protein
MIPIPQALSRQADAAVAASAEAARRGRTAPSSSPASKAAVSIWPMRLQNAASFILMPDRFCGSRATYCLSVR